SPWRIRKSRPTRRVYGKTKAPTERRLGLVSPRKDAMVSPRGPVVSLARHGGEMNPAWKFPRWSVMLAAGWLCALLAVSPVGDAFTAEDVKFSFLRAKGSKILHDKVRDVSVVDPYRVRFHLHEAWPDFMTFYGTLVSGASWVVPKKYIERVGDDGFKKQPVGLGPYKFVSHAPGIELVMEAFEGYWRKVPSVKR